MTFPNPKPARSFDRMDSLCFGGAENFADGSEPIIRDNDRFALIIGGQGAELWIQNEEENVRNLRITFPTSSAAKVFADALDLNDDAKLDAIGFKYDCIV